MAITEVKIDTMEPFADGTVFGPAGSYVRIKGVAKGEIDPTSQENHAIADLDKVPQNARGMVEYEADIFILRPVDPPRASGVLAYDVTNRGRKMIFNLLDDAPADADTNDPKTAGDVGPGLHPRARLHPGLVRLGFRCSARQQRDDRAAAARYGTWRTDGSPDPPRVPYWHPRSRHWRNGPAKLPCCRSRSAQGSADGARPRERRSYQNPSGMLGVCRSAINPFAAGRNALCPVQDLRSLVRGERISGARHWLCRNS